MKAVCNGFKLLLSLLETEIELSYPFHPPLNETYVTQVGVTMRCYIFHDVLCLQLSGFELKLGYKYRC